MLSSHHRVLSIPALACFCQLAGAQVVINELQIDNADSSINAEFVELFNAGPAPVTLDGWSLTGAIEFSFPPSTTIPSGGFLVIAGDPDTVRSVYPGTSPLGPYQGFLSNDGETLNLRDGEGSRIDRVDFRLGFPWPTVGEPPSPSLELLHPLLDNDLGGHWRSSGNRIPLVVPPATYIPKQSTSWQYAKGDTVPPDDLSGAAWSDAAYDTSAVPVWAPATAPVGFGDGDDRTVLDYMQGNYISVFLRHNFDIRPGQLPDTLGLELLYDDGVVLWLNGTQVGRYGVPGAVGTPLPEPVPDRFADNREAAGNYEQFTITGVAALLREGTNTLAAQLINERIGSSDTTIDLRLSFAGTSADAPFEPSAATPGQPNSVLTSNAPPAVRQIKHTPHTPAPAEPVSITAKITDPDGVSAVSLQYQIVEPGDYIDIDNPRYATEWTATPMVDDGSAGDETAGDSIYTAVLPADLQTHRRLVRYRVTASDPSGTTVTVPYRDDPSPNFAYFVYGDVPVWSAADRPGGAVVDYDFDQLQPLPVYHLITTRADHQDAQYIPDSRLRSGYTGSEYRWQGTLVYDGDVYDHIRFRARGGVWRYAMGKNMWKFDFNRGRSFRARDDYGRRYRTSWDKLNFSALIQQENIGRRGEQGLFEWAGFRIHNLLGNPAPKTHFVHFRIVEHADESGPTDSQYDTDFQGLYLAVEQMDGRFLDEHQLPDGNLYKMEGGTGELNNQGLGLPTRKQDLTTFMRNWRTNTPQTYWEENLDLDNYYAFYAGVTFVHDNDIHANKNYFFFNNPESGKWQLLNWDLDLTWTTTYRQSNPTDGPIDDYVFRHRDLNRDYRNRLRDGVDLLFNPDQTGALLDECASLVYTAGSPSFVDADRAMWDYNPIMRSRYVNSSKSGQGRYYARVNPRTYEGIISEMKRYIVDRRRRFIDAQTRHLRNESATIPATPQITYSGPAGFPATAITLNSSAFDDPQGTGTFQAMRWRIGEVSNPSTPGHLAGEPFIYEIDPVWESPESDTFQATATVPADVLRPGRTYRARVRHKDDTGNWSHWSDPLEFVAAAPDVSFYQQNLVISEFLYKPAPATAAERLQGYSDSDFEWIELQNLADAPLDLTDLRFTKGVDFDFTAGTTVPARGYALLVSNSDAFEFRYGNNLPVLGSFAPDNLSNGGEQLKLSLGAGTPVHDLTYDDEAPWPAEADTGGVSLRLNEPTTAPDHSLPESWNHSGAGAPSPGGATSPFHRWASGHGVSDALADRDFDGLPALLEFALGTDPSVASPAPLQFSPDGTTLTLARYNALAGVRLTVEVSTDLLSWTPLPDSALTSTEPGPENTRIESWQLPTQPNHYVRIRADQ